MVQASLYRSVTGTRVLANDSFFMAVNVGEELASLAILFAVAIQKQREWKRSRNNEQGQRE